MLIKTLPLVHPFELAQQAGPGFGVVVALAGVLAAQRMRCLAAAGDTTRESSHSYSALAQWLWHQDNVTQSRSDVQPLAVEESLAMTVQMCVQLLVPLLQRVAQRAWSVTATVKDAASKPPAVLSPEWAQRVCGHGKLSSRR